MSIASEIARIQGAKTNLKTSINAKTDAQHQITNETIDEYVDFVDSISSGGEGVLKKLAEYTQVEDWTGYATGGHTQNFYNYYISPNIGNYKVIYAVVSNNEYGDGDYSGIDSVYFSGTPNNWNGLYRRKKDVTYNCSNAYTFAIAPNSKIEVYGGIINEN